MAELDTMKQLNPHPHVIKLLGCVTESGKLIQAAVCSIRVCITLLKLLENGDQEVVVG